MIVAGDAYRNLRATLGWGALWLLLWILGERNSLHDFLTTNGWRKVDKGLYTYEGVL